MYGVNNLAQLAIFELDISDSDRSLLNNAEKDVADVEQAAHNNAPREERSTIESHRLSWGSRRNMTTGSTRSLLAGQVEPHDDDDDDDEDKNPEPPVDRRMLMERRSSHPLISALQALPDSRAQPVAATATDTATAVVARVDPMDQAGRLNDGDDDDNDHYESENSAHNNASKSAAKKTKPKGVLKKTKAVSNGRAGGDGRRAVRPLSAISKKYDLDGDGVLDEIEQAMRDRDLDGDGNLDNAEVARIVRDQLKSQHNVGLYRKVVAGLTCLVAVLTLTNFGTSWATAMLAKEVNADADSGAIMSKNSGQVMGFQQVGHVIELEELSDEEFEERRRLVDAEMAKDPDHEDHLHRRLGKKKNNSCTCSKIAYDHGKIKERDLEELTKKCDGANTVSMKRKWKDIMEGSSGDEDYDTICGPGTVVVRKQKTNKNKHKTKVKVVDEQVIFRKRSNDGRDKSISFTCKRGECYGSGGALLQREGHPCDIYRDIDGAGECDEGLVCYDPDGFQYGVGVCTRLQRYARSAQACDIDLGVDACVSGYACISTYSGGKNGKRVTVGQVLTGTCQRVVARSRGDEVCDVSFGNDACEVGYRCVGANGREITGVGIGYCVRSSSGVSIGGGWYVDYSLGSEGQCVNDGRHDKWDETMASAEECCEQKLWWMNKGQCVPGYNGWS